MMPYELILREQAELLATLKKDIIAAIEHGNMMNAQGDIVGAREALAVSSAIEQQYIAVMRDVDLVLEAHSEAEARALLRATWRRLHNVPDIAELPS